MIYIPKRSFFYSVVVVFMGLSIVLTSYGVPLPGSLLRTRFVFHLSRAIKKRIEGPLFNFHHITGKKGIDPYAQGAKDSIAITYNSDKSIAYIKDGKKTPLFLGSIPRKQKHIDRVKKAVNFNNEKSFKIALHTLNEPWECKTAGLIDLVKGNKELIQYTYSTPDFTPPTLINIIKAVYNIDHRDEQNVDAAFVHCKAGRGRSAIIVACYLALVMHKAGIEPVVEDIVSYLVSIRPQVSLRLKQKAAIKGFIQALKHAETIENLYTQLQEKA